MSTRTLTTTDLSMDHSTHLTIPILSPSELTSLQTFRKLLESDPTYPIHDVHIRAFCNDTNLHKFLKARGGDQAKALKMILTALEWRQRVQPHLIPASEIESEAAQGNLYVKSLDRWGRPIIIMNASVKPSKNDDLQLKALFFQIERARQKMNGNIDKYLIFINLEKFSVWSAPAMKTSMQTVETLLNRYPEHLGHAVLYKASFVFKGLWSAVSPFIDAKTKSKMLFIRGDTNDGSDNDKLLKRIIGDEWKLLTGVDESPASAPYRYNHRIDFPIIISEQQLWLTKYQKRLTEIDWKNGNEELKKKWNSETNTNALTLCESEGGFHPNGIKITITQSDDIKHSAQAEADADADVDVSSTQDPLAIPSHLTGETFEFTKSGLRPINDDDDENDTSPSISFHDENENENENEIVFSPTISTMS